MRLTHRQDYVTSHLNHRTVHPTHAVNVLLEETHDSNDELDSTSWFTECFVKCLSEEDPSGSKRCLEMKFTQILVLKFTCEYCSRLIHSL